MFDFNDWFLERYNLYVVLFNFWFIFYTLVAVYNTCLKYWLVVERLIEKKVTQTALVLHLKIFVIVLCLKSLSLSLSCCSLILISFMIPSQLNIRFWTKFFIQELLYNWFLFWWNYTWKLLSVEVCLTLYKYFNWDTVNFKTNRFWLVQLEVKKPFTLHVHFCIHFNSLTNELTQIFIIRISYNSINYIISLNQHQCRTKLFPFNE